MIDDYELPRTRVKRSSESSISAYHAAPEVKEVKESSRIHFRGSEGQSSSPSRRQGFPRLAASCPARNKRD